MSVRSRRRSNLALLTHGQTWKLMKLILARKCMQMERRLNGEQWGGIVQRGHPETLFLFRLKPKATTVRAPGPGPIRKTDWKPVAWKILKDRSRHFAHWWSEGLQNGSPPVSCTTTSSTRRSASWLEERLHGWSLAIPRAGSIHYLVAKNFMWKPALRS